MSIRQGQKDAGREVYYSHPPAAGKGLDQYFLSGEGQAQLTAAKAESLCSPKQGLCLFMEILQLPQLTTQHQKTSHSHRDSLTNKANDKAGDKHFTLCLHYKPGRAVPINAAQANNDLSS